MDAIKNKTLERSSFQSNIVHRIFIIWRCAKISSTFHCIGRNRMEKISKFDIGECILLY